MQKRSNISVIVPTYNEEQNVDLLVERLDRAFTKEDIVYEIIFIDDHSKDGTYEAATRLSAKYPVTIERKKGIKGKAHSLLQGFNRVNYELVAIIDADLQYPPEAIPGMM